MNPGQHWSIAVTLTRILILAVPCLLLVRGVAVAAAKKQGAQMSTAVFKQSARQAARPLVNRTSYRPDASRLMAER